MERIIDVSGIALKIIALRFLMLEMIINTRERLARFSVVESSC